MWKQNITDTFNFVVFKRKFEPPNSDELLEEVWSENQRLEKEVAECRNEVKHLASDNVFWRSATRMIFLIGILLGVYRKEIREDEKRKPPDDLPKK